MDDKIKNFDDFDFESQELLNSLQKNSKFLEFENISEKLVKSNTGSNDNSPFTSKGYLLKKDWLSYNTYDMGRAFFSNGFVTNKNAFQIFDNQNLLQKSIIKDEALYYKKAEIPLTIYTIGSEKEVLEINNKLEIGYSEIAVFIYKQDNQIKAKINLGDSLLKLSNFESENEMDSKTWVFSKEKLNKELSAKKIVEQLNKNNEIFSDEVDDISGLFSIQVKGFWSKDKEGKIKIKNINLGETVWFHLITEGIKDNSKIILELEEDDGGVTDQDKLFKRLDKKGNIIEEKIKITVYIKNGKSTFSLYLDELWAEMIDDDPGREIELIWKAYANTFERRVASDELNISYSKRHLFIKPAFENYNLPELLTKDGEAIIFSIGDFTKEEIKKQIIENIGKKIENYRYFLAARVLESGKVATNIGEVYERKKAIYSYNIFTNEGKKIKLKKASNFGFKIKYVNNGKLVTTKGISQIDYFANIGLKNKVLKVGTELTGIWDVFDLAKVFFNDDFSEIPVGYLGNPISFAYALLNENVIKPTTQGMIDDFKKGLVEDFETIHKPKGLLACKSFVDNKKIKTGFDYLEIFTPTLQKLLKNEFLTIDEMDKYNKSIQEREFINEGNKFITHSVFYKYEENKFGLNDDVFINCIFINSKLLND